MITKRLASLLFVVLAATSSLASAQVAVDANEMQSSAFPYAPVGSPNIE